MATSTYHLPQPHAILPLSDRDLQNNPSSTAAPKSSKGSFFSARSWANAMGSASGLNTGTKKRKGLKGLFGGTSGHKKDSSDGSESSSSSAPLSPQTDACVSPVSTHLATPSDWQRSAHFPKTPATTASSFVTKSSKGATVHFQPSPRVTPSTKTEKRESGGSTSSGGSLWRKLTTGSAVRVKKSEVKKDTEKEKMIAGSYDVVVKPSSASAAKNVAINKPISNRLSTQHNPSSLSHSPPFAAIANDADAPKPLKPTHRRKPLSISTDNHHSLFSNLNDQPQLSPVAITSARIVSPNCPSVVRSYHNSRCSFSFQDQLLAASSSARRRTSTTTGDGGGLSRPPLGNLFLGPLPDYGSPRFSIEAASVEAAQIMRPERILKVSRGADGEIVKVEERSMGAGQRMEVADKTEMGAMGMERVVESGLDSVRVRRERGMSVRSRSDLTHGTTTLSLAKVTKLEAGLAKIDLNRRPSTARKALDVEQELELKACQELSTKPSLSLVHRANSSLRALANRIDLSTSPARTISLDNAAVETSPGNTGSSWSPSPTRQVQSKAATGQISPVKLAGSRRVVPKARGPIKQPDFLESYPVALPKVPVAAVVETESSRVPFTSDVVAELGLGQTMGVERVLRDRVDSDVSVDSDVPDDLQLIIDTTSSTQPRPSSYASYSSEEYSPPHSSLGLPSPSTTQAPSPFGRRRRTRPRNLSDHLKEYKLGIPSVVVDSESDGGPSPQSATFDFTGELGKLNNGETRASFLEVAADAGVPLSPGGASRQANPSSSPPGELRKGFRFGAPTSVHGSTLPSEPIRMSPLRKTTFGETEIQFPPLPPQPVALSVPTIALVAPTPEPWGFDDSLPASPARAAYGQESSFISYDSPSKASSGGEEDVDMERHHASEFNTDRFSIVSDDSFKQQERHGASIYYHPPPQAGARYVHAYNQSVDSMASGVGSMIIRGGSANPFEFDQSVSFEQEDSFDLSGLASGLAQYSSSNQSAISLITTSSLGQVIPSKWAFPRSASGTTLNLDGTNPFHPIIRRPNSIYSNHSRNSSVSSVSSQHRRAESITNLSAVGGRQAPPVSLHNNPKATAAGARFVGGMGSRSTFSTGRVRTRSQTTGRPDWNRHRRQESSMSEMSSDGSYIVDLGSSGRPGLGNKMFVQEFGVPLTSITASPTDESFASHQDRPFDEDDDTASFTQVRNQRSFPLSKVSHPRTRVDSDASSTDECRTSMDTSADPVDIREHGRNDSANSSSSLFTSRGENSRPFMLKALRPVSGFSLESDSGADGDEDDTFAFQRQRVDAQEQQQQQYYDAPSVLSSSISSVPSTIPPFRVKDRPASMSSSIGHATANDTFQFLQQPNSKPSTFSHAVDDSFTQFELPSFCASADDSIYTLPVLIAPLTAREDPAPVSPLNISKRKAVLSQDEVSPRKARLVEATSQKEFEESMKGLEESRRSKESSRSIERGLRSRASLEDSCLVGSGEDSSFGSQDDKSLSPSPSPSSARKATRKPHVRPRAPNARNRSNNRVPRPLSLTIAVPSMNSSPHSVAVSETSSARSSLEFATISSAFIAPVTAGHFVKSHRARPSASGSINVQPTILEEKTSASSTSLSFDRSSSPPELSRSPSPPPSGHSWGSGEFPSPLFLHGREPDIVSNRTAEELESMKSWREWERDASFEFEHSIASWKDTEASLAELSHFTPPKKCGEIVTFLESSSRTFKPLSPAVRPRRTSSPRLSESRAITAPYASAPPSSSLPLKAKVNNGRRPAKFLIGENTSALASVARSLPSSTGKFARPAAPFRSTTAMPLQARVVPNANIPYTSTAVNAAPSLDAIRPVSPLKVSWKTATYDQNPQQQQSEEGGIVAAARKRVSSAVRRESFGWGRKKGDSVEPALPTIGKGGVYVDGGGDHQRSVRNKLSQQVTNAFRNPDFAARNSTKENQFGRSPVKSSKPAAVPRKTSKIGRSIRA